MDETQESGMDRRRFLTVLGVTGAGTAALSGCSTDRVQKLIPYMVQSEDQVPGIPTYYASTCTECASGCGLHVKTREARAIKLEGNPAHPVNAGKLCARGQAGLQSLYNPNRVRGPRKRLADGGFADTPWADGVAEVAARVSAAGGKVAVISGAGRGTFSDLLAAWTAAAGGTVVRYQPFDHEPMRAANQQVFGVNGLPSHDFASARMVVSFGADFLETWLTPIENQRGFAASHGYHDGTMSRLVALAPRMSLTGMNADEWFDIVPGAEAAIALSMAQVILAERSSAPPDAVALRGMLAAYAPDQIAQQSGLTADQIRLLAREFVSTEPSLAVAGGIGSQHAGAAQVCAAVNILNYVAGNVGKTVRFGADLEAGDGYAALAALQRRMDAGEIAVLVVHDANPVYALPKSAGFAAAMAKVPYKVSTALVLDETAALCDLILPQSHALERWDDLRPRAGIRSLMQPVMEPVYDTLPAGEVLLRVAKAAGGALAGLPSGTWDDYLKAQWQAFGRSRGAGDLASWWVGVLAEGGVYDAPPAPSAVRLAASAQQVSGQSPAFTGEGEFLFAPSASPMLYDGRGADKPWLLENPDPVTKITWQSWIEVHPETAAELDIREGEILRLVSASGSLEAPAYLYPGVRRDVVSAPLGYGHTNFGQYATGRGANALDLLAAPGDAAFLPYVSTRVTIEKTRRYQKVAKTEGSNRQLGRGIAEAMPLAAAARGLTPEEAHHEAAGGPAHEINTPRELEAIAGFAAAQKVAATKGNYVGDHPQWGMTIDLAKCTGCSACVTACYAENNIPTVGESEVLRGREMSWMRIERYYEGGHDGEPLETRFVPMLCQHCANAPCEPVCPVYAAYHTPDGLNGQVYNRCVGTRYCSNNCPFKVRYFNWFAYNKKAFPEPLHLQLNPDVTVRARGVMEKCTFCVQRIRGAQNEAALAHRPLRDGDVVTACAQACPSSAIIFGDRMDPESRVARSAADPRGYHVFEETNVRPSITYLAKVLHGAEA
ncbi:MAG TPA: molybdopterin dinucleotide binding domain-containing protein [Gemmatimonadales bacterium]|nr:molybdopterin dinucleotide binding domain-containing protein [Gemmatimonadales bacterium]